VRLISRSSGNTKSLRLSKTVDVINVEMKI